MAAGITEIRGISLELHEAAQRYKGLRERLGQLQTELYSEGRVLQRSIKNAERFVRWKSRLLGQIDDF